MPSCAFSFNPTRHALERWEERFPDQNMYQQYQASCRLGKKRFRRVAAGLHERNLRKICRYGGSTYMLLNQQSGAIFVMDKGAVVITVLKLPD